MEGTFLLSVEILVLSPDGTTILMGGTSKPE
jgi:hypothetical protein